MSDHNVGGIGRLKLNLHTALRRVGFDVVRTRPKWPPPRVTGTFPPHKEYWTVGRPENYFIHDGYQHRTEITYFNDTECTDEWQSEVYSYAREVVDEKTLASVCDIGCGSAYKLIKNFGDRNLVGLDVSATCDWLRKKYPHCTWLELDFANPPSLSADLVIAADVIEHVLDPDDLLNYIGNLNPRYIVLSTPDRNLMKAGTHNGPPRNPHHVREWSFAELEAYMGSRFEVLEHFISNNLQSTQCLLCKPRAPSTTVL